MTDLPTFKLGRRTIVLGRHVNHDPRSRDFPAVAATAEGLVLHVHHAATLNQGQIGSCTGNAMAQNLGTEPLWHKGVRTTEKKAQDIYSLGTKLDDIPGQWPPTDTGCSGIGVAKAAKTLGYISSYTHAFGIAHALGAVQLSPFCAGTNWHECVVPETRVLTADLEWVPAGKLEIGTRLVGFDESIDVRAAYRPSTVLTADRIRRPCVEIRTDRGTIVTSINHLFVETRQKAARRWRRADALVPGDRLQFFGDPWEADRSWEAGWLAGFYDGEGSLSGKVDGRSDNLLACSQLPGPTMDLALRILDAKGYDYGVKTNGETGVRQWYLRGENARCRFLGEIRPQRLLAKSEGAWNGTTLRRKTNRPAIVQSVRAVGDAEVVALGTDRGTLITEGFLSHNSMFTPDRDGYVRPTGNVAGGHEYEGFGYLPAEDAFVFLNSWGTSWGIPVPEAKVKGGAFKMTRADFASLLAAQGDITVPVV